MAAGSTYTPIASTVLTGNSTSITFNSFSGYTDLRLIIFMKNGSGPDYQIRVTVNGDGGTNYSQTTLRDASSLRITSGSFFIPGWCNASQYGTTKLDFMNYANTTTYKTVLSRYDDTSYYVGTSAMLWRSTSAITSINIVLEGGANMVSGSTFTLYGIAAA